MDNLQQEVFSSWCKSSRGNPRGQTFASVNYFQSFICKQTLIMQICKPARIIFPQSSTRNHWWQTFALQRGFCQLQVRFKITFHSLGTIKSPVCKYWWWTALPSGRSSSRGSGSPTGVWVSGEHCRRQCHRSPRLLWVTSLFWIAFNLLLPILY